MESYRIYLLSLQNKIGDAVYVVARDDADALVKAPSAFTTSAAFPAIEVWQGTRIVGRVSHSSGEA